MPYHDESEVLPSPYAAHDALGLARLPPLRREERHSDMFAEHLTRLMLR